MKRIRLTIRGRDGFIRKTCFSFVKRVRFEIDDFRILSPARLPISPPWRGDVFGVAAIAPTAILD
jgi:hypothetical protein